MNFIITGMPRTRTAWLANLLTTDSSLCYHEWFKDYLPTEENIRKCFKESGYRYVGNSDSSWPLRMNIIEKYFNETPIVVIRRDVDDVTRSVRKNFSDADYFPIWEAHLYLETMIEKLISCYNTLVVDFSDLVYDDIIEAIWYYCMPEIKIDINRLKLLQGFRITTIHETLGGLLCHLEQLHQ